MSIRAIQLGLTGRGLDKDVNSQGTATVTFRVIGTTNEADAIQADGIPAIGTVHPTLPGYNLDKYQTQISNDAYVDVICLYSSDKRFVLRKPNKDEPTYYDWGWAMRTVTIQLPYWIREGTFRQDSTVPVQVYRVTKIAHPERRVIRYLNVRIATTNTATFDVIAEQAGTLHAMPDGRLYLFEGGVVSKIDALTFEVTYTWMLDRGTKVPDSVRQLSVDESSPFPPDAGEFYRPAYHTISVVQRGDPATVAPLRVLIPQYVQLGDGQGWRSLPGGSRIG
jgi:hypothetical protein